MSCGYDRRQVFVSGLIDKTTQTCALCGDLHSAHKSGPPLKSGAMEPLLHPLIGSPLALLPSTGSFAPLLPPASSGAPAPSDAKDGRVACDGKELAKAGAKVGAQRGLGQELTVTWTHADETETMHITANRSYNRLLDKIADKMRVPPVSIKMIFKDTGKAVTLTDKVTDGAHLIVYQTSNDRHSSDTLFCDPLLFARRRARQGCLGRWSRSIKLGVFVCFLLTRVLAW